MFKNRLKTLVLIILMLALIACGKSDNNDKDKKEEDKLVVEVDEKEDEADQEEVNDDVLVVGKSIEKGDTGSGPVAIESRLGLISIPEGLDYKLYTAPFESGETSSIRVNFGEDDTSAGHVEVSTTRMIKSLDDAVTECIRTNDFGTLESIIGEEITYGDRVFKEVTIKKPDDSDIRHYLVSYYEAENDWDGYIEIHTAGEGNYYNMDIKDPLVSSIIKSLVVK